MHLKEKINLTQITSLEKIELSDKHADVVFLIFMHDMEFGVIPSSGNILDGFQSSLETISPDQLELFENSPPNLNKCLRLLPLCKQFFQIEITKEVHTFGRGDQCDVRFVNGEADRCLKSYSKLHFALVSKVTTSTAGGARRLLVLVDHSSNGTFVNGVKIGKGCKRVLNSDDEISISMAKNRAYIFIDIQHQSSQYPSSLTGKYIISRTLGKGASAIVRLVFENGTATPYAMKIMQKGNLSFAESMCSNNSKRINAEIEIMKTVDHPNIIKYIEMYDTPDALYTVLEYAEGGDLFKKIKRSGKLTETISKSVTREIAKAMLYLHNKSIIHRDLKAENILMTNEGHVKITDFGLSKYLHNTTKLNTFCGTAIYMAPELLEQSGSKVMPPYTSSVDVWSFGVLLYICLCGYPPFSPERSDHSLRLQIEHVKYTFHDRYWGEVSTKAKDLISKLLCKNIESRLTFDEILQHPWYQNESSSLNDLGESSRVTEAIHQQLSPTNKANKRKVFDESSSYGEVPHKKIAPSISESHI